MRVLVCGGRNFNDYVFLCEKMNDLHCLYDFEELCHGGARGADILAGEWWTSLNINDPVVFKANWKKYGNSAGPIRNRKMLKEFDPKVVVGFPDPKSKGTYDMLKISHRDPNRIVICFD